MDRKPERLIDLNMSILRFFLDKTGVAADLRLTEEYVSADVSGSVLVDGKVRCEDLRERIHPKRHNDVLSELGLEKPYFQVFSQKYGFLSDLSVMDLLFNEGPDSILYLKNL